VNSRQAIKKTKLAVPRSEVDAVIANILELIESVAELGGYRILLNSIRGETVPFRYDPNHELSLRVRTALEAKGYQLNEPKGYDTYSVSWLPKQTKPNRGVK
jgi:hypothetical protein